MKKAAFILIIILFPALAIKGWTTGNSTEHKTIITIPEVALLAVQSGVDDAAEFNSTAPNSAAGSVHINQVNQGCWINYSSVISRNHYRKITAAVTGEIPAGIILKMNVSECMGKKMGEIGQGLKSVTLSNSPTEIISGIGSGFTGTGGQNGHYVSCEYEINDTESYLVPSKINTSVYVIFTLSDDN